MQVPTFLMPLVEGAVEMLLSHMTTSVAKQAMAKLLLAVNGAVQAEEARVTGPFKGVADEVAVAFDTAAKSIAATLQAP